MPRRKRGTSLPNCDAADPDQNDYGSSVDRQSRDRRECSCDALRLEPGVAEVVGLLAADEQSLAADPDAGILVELRVDREDARCADDDVIDIASTLSDRDGVQDGPPGPELGQLLRDLQFAECTEVPGARVVRERRSTEQTRDT